MKWRLWIVAGTLVAAACALVFVPRIPQDEAYHAFADQRVLLGIPHCLDVISNAVFLIVGLWGILVTARRVDSPHFIDSRERWPYVVFFLGVTLTAFGSAYYHLRPDSNRLVWDRVPMTVGFMGLVAAVVCERVGVKAGLRLLAPLVAFGMWSVWYWRATELTGRGDLRPYGFVQFGSLVAILLLIGLFPARYTRGWDFVASLGIYGAAKALEAADAQIFALGGIVSGHTLKHVAAAISAYWILRMLRQREPFANVRAS